MGRISFRIRHLDFSIISLYQIGFIRHLPDFPGKIFDSDKVNASNRAYQMGLPDGPVSLGMYSANLMLASWKGSEKSGRPLIADVALAGTVLANAIGATFYMKNMIKKQQEACPYCIFGALVNFATVPFVAANLWDKMNGRTAAIISKADKLKELFKKKSNGQELQPVY